MSRGRSGAPKGAGSGRPKGGGKPGPAKSSRPKSGRGNKSRATSARRSGPSPAPDRQRGRQSSRSTSRAKQGAGGDQVEGRNAVRELLSMHKRPVHEVIMATDLDPAAILDEIEELCVERRVPITRLSRAKVDAQARTDAPQGVIALADPIEGVDIEDLIAAPGLAFLVALDGVTDPGNLGALLRSAECAGATGAVLPKHRAATVGPTTTKAAAGAVEHLPIALVGGLPAAIEKAKSLGVWVVGLDGSAKQTLADLTIATEPVMLVLGAEGSGLSRLVRQRCDQVVRIPMAGRLDSLNVAAAGAVACFEITRRRESTALGSALG